MRNFMLFSLLLVAIHCQGQTNEGMPCARDIVSMFFYHFKGTQSNDRILHFEKRKDGWYVAEVDYPSMQVKSSRMFWNRATRSIVPMQYTLREGADDTTGVKDDIDNYLRIFIPDEQTSYFYSRNLYYGYSGWEWDVITELEGRTSLTDSLYQALGSSYGYYALGFLCQFEGHFLNNDSDRTPLKDNVPVPDSRVKQFVYYVNKAIDAYKKLVALNSNYQGLVGNALTELQVLKMQAYTFLRFAGHEKEAAMFLEGTSFPASMMQPARRRLEDAKPNSILITDRDSITYPVWLLQEQGVRKDVTVIDYSSMAMRRVIYYLDRKYRHELFDTDSTIYGDRRFDYAIYQHAYGLDSAIALGRFLKDVYKSPGLESITREGKTISMKEDSSFKFFHKNIYVPVNVNMAKKLYGAKQFVKEVSMPVQEEYLLISDMILYAIVEKNFLRRRIYFAGPVFENRMKPGIVRHELVWELTPEMQ